MEGQFLSWKIAGVPVKQIRPDGEDRVLPALLFINKSGPTTLKPQERRQVRSHVMRRHKRKTNEKIMDDKKRRREIIGQQLPSSIDQVSAVGGLDPFDTLPVTVSRSDGRLLHHFVQHIAPLHYPNGTGAAEHNPMTTTWVARAMSDIALLHSTLSSSSGHMLHYTKLTAVSPVHLAGFLYHKTETIRTINERIKDNSKLLTDETLGAIALLITAQTRQGDYNEMKVHMRGLTQLVNMRGGLNSLGMGGLLAGEILWCDNVTAFASSAKPLLAMPEMSNGTFDSFEDPELNIVLANAQASNQRSSASLWCRKFEQIASNDLIAALHSLHTMTAFLDTSPSLSKHDMLVYDRKRAFIQHQLADIAIPPISLDTYHMTESCRLAAITYSIAALWGYRPPMSLYGELAKMLQKALQSTNDVCDWGPWSDILLWTLFIGGYAAIGGPERCWFSKIVREVLRRKGLQNWHSFCAVFETMPVCQALWGPFEALWWEATAEMLWDRRSR